MAKPWPKTLQCVKFILVFFVYSFLGQYELDPRCDKYTAEWTRDPNDCTKAYHCVFGSIIQRHYCNDSRIWSIGGRACVLPMSAHDDCNQAPTTPTLNDPRCINPDGINPDPDNCAKFIACYNRTVLAIMDCPARTLFSVASNNTCALSFLVADECKGRSIPTDIEVTTPVPKIDEPCTLVPDGDVPDPKSCRRFYKCNYGRIVARMRCQPGLAFSSLKRKCDWISRVKCQLQK